MGFSFSHLSARAAAATARFGPQVSPLSGKDWLVRECLTRGGNKLCESKPNLYHAVASVKLVGALLRGQVMRAGISALKNWVRSALLLGFVAAAPSLIAAEQSVLFAENFESGKAVGWLFDGKGKNEITEYEGNRSLNLSRQRNAQIAVDVADYSRIDMIMQLAAFDLKKGESCKAEVSSNGGERWQTLLTVTPAMADGITLHSNTGRIKNPGSLKQMLLRFRADGGRKAKCWGDNVEILGKRKRAN